ncbi:MAG: methylmalonyl-CoA mutase family protein [Acidobacteria bacterium]|nr:methylmalonyl-CoA mutase family protein [Acidobacteriota bacterium]MCI0720231.1 methylmalonyl-CoA mutase family protein [Acidobacteriota bacterium]
MKKHLMTPEDCRESDKHWQEKTLEPFLQRAPERLPQFTSLSGNPVKRLYTPADVQALDYQEDLGYPGQPPYTRGIHPTMYRGKLWTMRQFSGFGTSENTNARFHYLLEQGQSGLSVAFHLPTLMGLDSDHPMAEGEVGKCGVAVDSLADMEVLFSGIDLEKTTTSMTINAPAPVLWAMYLVNAEKRGFNLGKVSGTIQNDILKEYIAQKTWIFPPRPSMRLITDIFRFGVETVPRWNTISISGYHIREAGSTAVQELAFTLRNGIEYVEAALQTGLDVDKFAPRLSFFFNAHNDLFEEVAKYRAARKIWCRVMQERFHARDPRSWALRFHTQTAGCSLTAQQPYNNIVRTAIQALAAVLGGTQSLHTNSMDETYALPTEQAVAIALRTQQVLAAECGVANTVDPLAGSYYVETLTKEMEQGCWDYFEKIDAMGGMVTAIEYCFPQREIQDAAYHYQRAVERKEKLIVGVNEFVSDEEPSIETLAIDSDVAAKQKARLREVRASRNAAAVQQALDDLRRAATGTDNLMPQFMNCARQYATLGEVCDVLRAVFGTYVEPIF